MGVACREDPGDRSRVVRSSPAAPGRRWLGVDDAAVPGAVGAAPSAATAALYGSPVALWTLAVPGPRIAAWSHTGDAVASSSAARSAPSITIVSHPHLPAAFDDLRIALCLQLPRAEPCAVACSRSSISAGGASASAGVVPLCRPAGAPQQTLRVAPGTLKRGLQRCCRRLCADTSCRQRQGGVLRLRWCCEYARTASGLLTGWARRCGHRSASREVERTGRNPVPPASVERRQSSSSTR